MYVLQFDRYKYEWGVPEFFLCWHTAIKEDFFMIKKTRLRYNARNMFFFIPRKIIFLKTLFHYHINRGLNIVLNMST